MTRLGWGVAAGLAVYLIFMHSVFITERRMLLGPWQAQLLQEIQQTEALKVSYQSRLDVLSRQQDDLNLWWRTVQTQSQLYVSTQAALLALMREDLSERIEVHPMNAWERFKAEP